MFWFYKNKILVTTYNLGLREYAEWNATTWLFQKKISSHRQILVHQIEKENGGEMQLELPLS